MSPFLGVLHLSKKSQWASKHCPNGEKLSNLSLTDTSFKQLNDAISIENFSIFSNCHCHYSLTVTSILLVYTLIASSKLWNFRKCYKINSLHLKIWKEVRRCVHLLHRFASSEGKILNSSSKLDIKLPYVDL